VESLFLKKTRVEKEPLKDEGKAESNSEGTSLCRLPKISRYYTDGFVWSLDRTIWIQIIVIARFAWSLTQIMKQTFMKLINHSVHFLK
jgi:beta-glucanase (GH16 family)